MKPLVLAFATGSLLLAPTLASAKQTNPDMTGKQERQMANCPSAVPRATTSIANRESGVVLTVTSNDAAAIKEIQRRAQRQAHIAAQPARGALEHTGAGTGSGQFGFCPGMQEGSRVKVADLANGARIEVRAEPGTEVDHLRTSTRARLRRLEAKR